MKKIVFLSLLIFSLPSCDVFKQIGGAIQLSQCEYKYNSISDMQLAGINLGDGSTISLSNFASISSILTGGNLQTIPFSMTLKMDVKNPNQAVAFLNALEYAIEIMKNIMNRYSRDRVARELSGFLGLSSDETKVTVKLWPKLMVGNTPIKVPAPIPVVFTFGGSDK